MDIMDNSFDEDRPRQKLLQITQEEIDIINDIRRLNFGRITLFIQDGTIISKEVTVVTKHKRKENNSRNMPGYNI